MVDVIKQATRDSYGQASADLNAVNPNVSVLDADLAATSKTVFASTFAMYAAGRAFEQVRNSIGYPT